MSVAVCGLGYAVATVVCFLMLMVLGQKRSFMRNLAPNGEVQCCCSVVVDEIGLISQASSSNNGGKYHAGK